MRKSFLWFILLNLLCCVISAQQIYFNKRYNFNIYDTGDAVLPDSNTYIVISAGDDSSLFPVITYISRLDSIGEVLWSKPFTIANCNVFDGGYGSVLKRNNNFVNAGTFQDSGNRSDVRLTMFNNFGDTLWNKTYGDTLFQSGWNLKQTRDGGYIITGQTATYDPDGDVLLIKTDSLGNLQWQKHYGGAYYDIGLDVDTCIDGGYIIVGYTQSFGVNAGSSCGNMYCIKTDSMGNEQWYRALGGQYDDGGYAVVQCRDSNLIFGGYYSSYDPSGGTSCDEPISYPWIVKLDIEGNSKWSKTFGDSLYDTGLFMIRELPDGSIVGAGDNTVVNTAVYLGLILKANSNGDSLWYRTYSLLKGSKSLNFLNDIRATNDGGFIATGYVVPLAPDTGTQDVWVLKIDSEGCEVANCVVSGIEPIEDLKHFSLSNYPNPFNTGTVIEALVPDGSKDATIEIVDVMGKIIGFYRLIAGDNKIEVSANDMNEGIYFYSLFADGKRLATSRMVLMK